MLTTLKVQWRYYKTALAPEFHILLDALDEMARRWIGPILKTKTTKCLATLYASQLRELHGLCEEDPDYDIDVLGYSSDVAHSTPTILARADGHGSSQSPSLPTQAIRASSGVDGFSQPRRTSFAGVFSPGSRFSDSAARGSNHITDGSHEQVPMTRHDSQSQPDGLAAISHTLLNEDFLSMDRIISLDDMIFAAPNGTPLPWMTTEMG